MHSAYAQPRQAPRLIAAWLTGLAILLGAAGLAQIGRRVSGRNGCREVNLASAAA